jgi:hypothetical protein
MEEAEKNSLPKLSGKNARRGKMDTKESRDLAIESALSQLNLHTALGLDDFVAIRKAIAGEGRLLLDEKDFTSRDKFALWYMERNPNHFITLAYQFADEALAARQGRGWTITQPLETTETGQDQGGK